MKRFRLQVLLNNAFYWSVSLEMLLNSINSQQNYFGMFSMVYIPAVMGLLAYGLLYEQLRNAMVESRVRGGLAFRQRFRSDRWDTCLKIFTIIFMIGFACTQLALTILLYFNKVSIYTYGILSAAFMGTIVVSLNGR